MERQRRDRCGGYKLPTPQILAVFDRAFQPHGMRAG